MPSNIGNSILNTSYLPGGPGGRGPQGPPGPQGPTGNTGPIGNTGSVGYGILSLAKNNDTVVITLNDPSATTITINGLTGNTGGAPSVYGSSPNQYYEFRGTFPSSDTTQNLLLVQSVNGVTTTFKVLEGVGITFSNNGNDFVIEGPNSVSVKTLLNNTIVGVSGATAISLVVTEYYGGITYDVFSSTGITGFLQSLTNNINTTNQTVTIQNSNISINQMYYDGTDKKWYSKNTFKFNNGSSTTTVIDQNTVFDSNNYLNYPYIPSMGSCCFCNTDDTNVNSTVCYDYMTEEQCAGFGGVYKTTSCSTRSQESACRNSVPENGACCTCGSNYDDPATTPNIASCTQSLPKQQCLDLGFKYIVLPGGADCSSVLATCDKFECDKVFAKKK